MISGSICNQKPCKAPVRSRNLSPDCSCLTQGVHILLGLAATSETCTLFVILLTLPMLQVQATIPRANGNIYWPRLHGIGENGEDTQQRLAPQLCGRFGFCGRRQHDCPGPRCRPKDEATHPLPPRNRSRRVTPLDCFSSVYWASLISEYASSSIAR
jgi:hypothetical protein